jgi:hypothetical protein
LNGHVSLAQLSSSLPPVATERALESPVVVFGVRDVNCAVVVLPPVDFEFVVDDEQSLPPDCE